MLYSSIFCREIMTERRFPPPWTLIELEACFVVCDSAGQRRAKAAVVLNG